MPEFMQTVAKFSPMNWGLNAYYDIILRNSGIGGIAKELVFLFYFTCHRIRLYFTKESFIIFNLFY
jgi:ABC-type multidrug transport system permease subunit